MNVHERSVEKRNIRPLLGGVARSAKTEARHLLELGSDPSRSTLDETSRVQIPHNGFIFCRVTVGHPSVTVWMTRPVTGGPSTLDTLGAALWAEDSGGRELEDPGSLAKVQGALQDAGAPRGGTLQQARKRALWSGR